VIAVIDAAEFADALRLTVLAPPRGQALNINTGDVNRPGIQLMGFWDYFAYERPQVLGKVEVTYLDSLDAETRAARFDTFLGYDLPCIVICRGYAAEGKLDDLISLAAGRGIPVYGSGLNTNRLSLDLINYLNNRLAPRVTKHGVFVDVYGVGILIMGSSGVGKSEAALELIKRGHRLVADDVVDIRRVTDTRLVGESPEMVRHFMEIRGVGIIDITTMYGIGAVIDTKSIDLVVHMENWIQGKEYDRLGMDDQYIEILGVDVPTLLLPIHPGRNLAIVLEVAARNQRLKQQGYIAARELDRRLMLRLRRSAEEDGDGDS
jgi:HPr kinase/phosphorylase